MPPLSYYSNIIDKYIDIHKDKIKLIIVSENTRNPCVNELLKKYKNNNIHYTKQSLMNDMEIILSATNIIESFGSFIPALLLFSDHIENLYSPSYQFKNGVYRFPKEYMKHINFYTTNLDEYKESIYPWKNTNIQRNIMINYLVDKKSLN